MDEKMIAKINEFLKSSGKQALSIDEMERVVGGKFDSPVGMIKDEGDLYNFVYYILGSIEEADRGMFINILNAWQPDSPCAGEAPLVDDYYKHGLRGIYDRLEPYI